MTYFCESFNRILIKMLKKKVFKVLLLLIASWFLIHETVIIYDGLADDNNKTNFGVVLGTTVNEDGTLSERLKARLDCGIKLYHNKQVKQLFVSGGLGKEGHYEGTKMAEYLTKNGVPQHHIYIDNKGNTTGLTAKNFVFQFPNEKNVIVISQFFHISRTKLAFKQAGIEHAYGVHANYFEWRDVYSTFREFFGYYKYLIFNP